jgi:hypothetical protein
MLQNIQIFNAPIGTPASGTYYGPWTSVGNLAAFSVYFTGLEGNVWVEASNNPNVNYSGIEAIGAPIAPTLSTFQYGALTNQGTVGIAVSYIVQGGGETVASTAGTVAVPDGYQLVVNSPILEPLGLAIAYNVYANKNGGPYSLQNMPNSSDRFGSSHCGPMPLGRPYILYDGVQNNGVPSSVVALVGGPAVGVNLLGTGGITTDTTGGNENVNYNSATGDGSFSPGGLDWGYIRVGKSGANAVLTQGWVSGRFQP